MLDSGSMLRYARNDVYPGVRALSLPFPFPTMKKVQTISRVPSEASPDMSFLNQKNFLKQYVK